MPRSTFTRLEIANIHNGEDCTIETVWEFGVTFYPLIPATYLDPPEGGPEIDGDPELVRVIISDAEGNKISDFNRKHHKEILEILAVSIDELDLTPSDEDMRTAMEEYGDPDDHGPW